MVPCGAPVQSTLMSERVVLTRTCWGRQRGCPTVSWLSYTPITILLSTWYFCQDIYRSWGCEGRISRTEEPSMHLAGFDLCVTRFAWEIALLSCWRGWVASTVLNCIWSTISATARRLIEWKLLCCWGTTLLFVEVSSAACHSASSKPLAVAKCFYFHVRLEGACKVPRFSFFFFFMCGHVFVEYFMGKGVTEMPLNFAPTKFSTHSHWFILRWELKGQLQFAQ